MANPDQVSFGVLLKRHRLAIGLTQEAVAERAGMSAKAISDLERDPQRTPRLGSVALLADALDLSAEARAEMLQAARPNTEGSGAFTVPEMPRLRLPRPLTPLLGRAGVAEAVVEVVRMGETQLLTLTGPGGVGKTRLAIEMAHRLAGDYLDGAVFVDLAPLRDSSLVLATIATELGVDQRDGTSLPDRIVTSLRDKRLLLLLDNFEHLLAASLSLITLLEECPGVMALVTSRVALRVRGGREYVVAPLALPESVDSPERLLSSPAVALFVERARAAGVELVVDSATLGVVAGICRRLDGLPLAIELAAARVRLLPPAALLVRLQQRLPLLAGGSRDLPARQKTMGDAIAWSYDLLDPPEKRLFRQLCVFASGCSFEAVERVCEREAGQPAGLEEVATLTDNSLVHLDVDLSDHSPRVRLLETIREYGLEQLEIQGEGPAVHHRHLAYYLDLAEKAQTSLIGPEGPIWLATLAREHDNLRTAMAWAEEQSDASAALRLTGAMWRFWQERGPTSEGRQWLQRAIDLGGDSGDPPLLINALVGAAYLAIQEGDHVKAEGLTTRALALAREHGETSLLVVALNVTGLLAREQDRYSESAGLHQEALERARDGGDLVGQTQALFGLAFAAMVTGDAIQAGILTEESRTLAHQLGDRLLIARAVFLLAWQATQAGEFGLAESLGAEGLSLIRAGEGDGERAEMLFLLGTVALYRGQPERALNFLAETVAIDGDLGHLQRQSRNFGGLSAALFGLGDLAGARERAEASLTISRRFEDRWGEAMALTILGHVQAATGDDEGAAGRFGEAATLFLLIENLIYLPWLLEGIAGICARRTRFEQAAQLDGARQAVRAQMGVTLPPFDPAGYEAAVAAVRQAMSDEAWARARATGETRPPDQTIAEALAT